MNEQSQEIMLCFNNKQKSNMHLIMQGDFQEFFDLLKLRWANFNNDKTLKVFGVPEKSLMQYHQSPTANKYNIDNIPGEELRLRDEEVMSHLEYNRLQSGVSETIDNDSQNFEFANSRQIENPGSTEMGFDDNLQDFAQQIGGEGVADQALIEEMRNTKLIGMNNQEEGQREPTLADFKMIIVLGKGTFGKVFLAEFQFNKQLYAIKVIRKDVLIEYNQIKNTKLEKDIMFQCQHQFLVGMEFLFMSDLRLFFVMPFIRGGELYRFFKAKRRFKEHEVKFYAAQIALALGYLHKKGIIHRDLKLENILVDMNGYLKIIDFGLAKILDSEQTTKTYCGTPEYLAPEMISQSGHNFSIDWWALGILIYEMRIGVTPFFNKNKNLLLTKIQRAKVIFPDKQKYNLDYTPEFVDIVEKLLEKGHKQRLGSINDVHEVLEHPWFKDIDISKLEAQKIEPPLRPDVKKNQVDFKYFNLKQQSLAESFMPPEKVTKVSLNKHKFDGFDSDVVASNTQK